METLNRIGGSYILGGGDNRLSAGENPDYPGHNNT